MRDLTTLAIQGRVLDFLVASWFCIGPIPLQGCAFAMTRRAPLVRVDRKVSASQDTGFIPYDDMPLKVQRQHVKRRYCCKSLTIILGITYLETTAFFGVSTNLVVYFHSVLHGNNASNAATVSTWLGVAFLLPVFGAILADSYWGKYRTILISLIILVIKVPATVSTWLGAAFLLPVFGAILADSYWGKYRTILISLIILVIGMATITISATVPSLRPPPCKQNMCASATLIQKLVFLLGLYVAAFGCGGIKSTLLTFGAEQFDNNNQQEREEKASYFSWYYAIINLGMLTAGTLLVWTEERISWGLGYGICASFVAVAAMGFVIGSPIYRIVLPEGSPLTGIFQVLAAFTSKANLRAPLDASMLYDEDINTSSHLVRERLEHTDHFSFLDKAAVIRDSDREGNDIPWNLCTVTQVEKLKLLLRLIPIWATSVVYSAADAQVSTIFVQQGSQMDTRIIESISIPPASLASFKLASVTACALLYNKAVVPMARRYLNKTEVSTQLRSMGIGHFLMTVAMAIASYVEACRLERARAGQSMNIRWLLPQYFIMAVSDSFNRTSQLEFLYDQSPESMRSVVAALFFLSISFGHLLSSQIVTLVSVFTTAGGKAGWIPPDLDNGHLDYYFLVLAGISMTNTVAYVLLAMNYTPKRVR